MEMIEKLVATLSGIVWGAPMLVLLVGTGLYLTIILRGMQFWALPHALKLIFHKESDGEGEISHFAALMTALAATVGIGNIVGVATAITLGGPGAVFWMWMTGLVGMATKYSEAVLAVKYRQKGHHHGFKGGPMYYLTYGLNMPKLGMAFAIFTAIAAFGIGNMTQANAVAQILSSEMAVPTWVTGVVLLTLTAVVILGGIKSIGNFTSFLVPFMILAYVSVSLIILAMNLDKLGDAFGLIFHYAFSPIAAGGGFVGATMAAAIRYGVARGVFSNESGLGSAPIAAAAAKTNDPVRQALVSMTQTFIDTLVVCTMTALIILISPFWQQGVSPSALTMQSFQLYLGTFGGIVVVISTVLFAYSTILGWSYYGEKAFEYIFGERFIRLYRVLFIVGVMVGSMLKLEFVWNFSDLMNGMMAIPNLIALLLLSRVISAESKRYFESLK
ncbi:sodium:alanine symporter family protein [Sulfurospirillum diekertiae]|uniref:Sodium:alanine symporter family protein n=1 Tax=Sulfurospirillum diekertiae TaxID=1854492 RepID=A0A6G9VRJ8_9BACT|nr:sodium:alanine symporter family protein [Sulfurospirillum diekertiae]QIR75975.1 sodium:alanine symporter family protein [Sulfurospirillum diekertiae]QIR78619.1 sodium:alanine symporter family protein [Sulfurospirillum diekertiae]